MQHLDTVIAFAAVMLGISLIITAGTQIVVSLLGLRGTNLRRSLMDLFETACVDRDARRYAREIARRVLCYPLISDSVFSRFRIPVEEIPFVPPDAAGKLQGAASGIPFRPWLLGALGGFFAWPIALAITKRLFFPDVCQYLDVVAHAVPLLNLCERPGLSGAILGAISGGLLSRWRLATSIRFEELVATLEKLSEPPHGTLPTRVQCAMLVIAGEAQSEPRPKAKPVAAQVERLVEDAHAEGGVAVAVEKAVAQTPANVEPRLEGLKSWFDHAMDRASQRFTLQTRMVTVALAAVFVFAAHLDAIRLFQTLSSEAQLRAQLVATADAIAKQADSLRTRDGAFLAARGGRAAVPEVYRKAMTLVLQTIPAAPELPRPRPRPAPRSDDTPSPNNAQPQPGGGMEMLNYLLESPNSHQAVGAPQSTPPAAEQTAAPAKKEDTRSAKPGKKEETKPGAPMNPKTTPKGLPKSTPLPREYREIYDAKAGAAKALEATPGFASREDAVSWLRTTLDGDPAADFLVAAYEQELDAQLVSDSDKMLDHSASLKRELARSELQLIPEKWPGWEPTSRELPGLLIAVAFLSLGAPFWYNTLKKLTSLRPLLAVKHENQHKWDNPAGIAGMRSEIK